MITINLEVDKTVKEEVIKDGEPVLVDQLISETKTLEGKLNYYAYKSASDYYDKLNKEIFDETGVQQNLSLINTYNELVSNPSPMSLVEVMWIIFNHEKNGGLTFNQCEEFINDISMDDGLVEAMTEDILIAMEDSGFFMKNLREAQKAIDEKLIPDLEKDLKEAQEKGQTAMELQIYLDKLNSISTEVKARDSARTKRIKTAQKQSQK